MQGRRMEETSLKHQILLTLYWACYTNFSSPIRRPLHGLTLKLGPQGTSKNLTSTSSLVCKAMHSSSNHKKLSLTALQLKNFSSSSSSSGNNPSSSSPSHSHSFFLLSFLSLLSSLICMQQRTKTCHDLLCQAVVVWSNILKDKLHVGTLSSKAHQC